MNCNQPLATTDKLGNMLEASKRKLRKMSSGMLTGIGQEFGTDSDEYEQASGTRGSERKTLVRKAKAAPNGAA